MTTLALIAATVVALAVIGVAAVFGGRRALNIPQDRFYRF